VYQTAGDGINAAAMTAVAAEQFVEIHDIRLTGDFGVPLHPL